MSKGDRKSCYFTKVHQVFRNYKKIFVVGVTNVGSNQMHLIRAAIREHAVILMGKNTLIKCALREIINEIPEIDSLLPYIKGNVGFVCTNGDLETVRKAMTSFKVTAPAKVGAIAQCDVIVPAGNTSLPPDKTSFFQALDIATKVVKGSIEIVSDVLILKEGSRVGASEAELLTMLNIKPFSYGLTLLHVYENGSVYNPCMLDMTSEKLLCSYQNILRNVAALSFACNLPTLASAPHSVANGFKNLLALSVAAEYSTPMSEKILAAIANPQAFAPVAAPSAPAASKAAPAPAAKVEEKEASDEDLGFGLFD